jgi:hypothetical protein
MSRDRAGHRVRTDYDPTTDVLVIERREVDPKTGELIEQVETVGAYMQTIRLEAYLKSEMILPENYQRKGLV